MYTGTHDVCELKGRCPLRERSPILSVGGTLTSVAVLGGACYPELGAHTHCTDSITATRLNGRAVILP